LRPKVFLKEAATREPKTKGVTSAARNPWLTAVRPLLRFDPVLNHSRLHGIIGATSLPKIGQDH
jgi:hypothetical protein